MTESEAFFVVGQLFGCFVAGWMSSATITYIKKVLEKL